MSYRVISRFRDRATGDYVDPSPEPWVPHCPKEADRLVKAGCLKAMPTPVAAGAETENAEEFDAPKPKRRRKRRNRQAD